jgi:hypothetical protein
MFILNFLNEYYPAISVLSLIGGGLFAFFKFREYLKDKRFKTYHELIDELVNEQRNPDRVIKLDRQIAIVFELRNFSNYYPLSIRILSDLKDTWDNPRIIKEIDLSLNFMKSNYFSRILLRLKKDY